MQYYIQYPILSRSRGRQNWLHVSDHLQNYFSWIIFIFYAFPCISWQFPNIPLQNVNGNQIGAFYNPLLFEQLLASVLIIVLKDSLQFNFWTVKWFQMIWNCCNFLNNLPDLFVTTLCSIDYDMIAPHKENTRPWISEV